MATIIILAVFGIALLGLEVFLPGGVLGVLGLGCSVASVVLCFTVDEVAEVGMWLSFVLAGCVVGITTAALIFWLKHFQQTGVGKRFVLESVIGGEKDDKKNLIGEFGEAIGTLEPLGKIRIGGAKLDARAESGVLEAGTRVKVVGSGGMELVVRAVEDDEAAS